MEGSEAAYLKILLLQSISAYPFQFCIDFDKSVEPDSYIKGFRSPSIIFSDLPSSLGVEIETVFGPFKLIGIKFISGLFEPKIYSIKKY